MGTWAYSYGFTNSQALGELAKQYIEAGVDGKNFRRKFKKEDLVNAYNAATPGATWNGKMCIRDRPRCAGRGDPPETPLCRSGAKL